MNPTTNINLKTARILNRAIEDFFLKGNCWVYKSNKTKNPAELEEVFNSFKNRLKLEFNYTYLNDYIAIISAYDGITCYKVINTKSYSLKHIVSRNCKSRGIIRNAEALTFCYDITCMSCVDMKKLIKTIEKHENS